MSCCAMSSQSSRCSPPRARTTPSAPPAGRRVVHSDEERSHGRASCQRYGQGERTHHRGAGQRTPEPEKRRHLSAAERRRRTTCGRLSSQYHWRASHSASPLGTSAITEPRSLPAPALSPTWHSRPCRQSRSGLFLGHSCPPGPDSRSWRPLHPSRVASLWEPTTRLRSVPSPEAVSSTTSPTASDTHRPHAD